MRLEKEHGPQGQGSCVHVRIYTHARTHTHARARRYARMHQPTTYTQDPHARTHTHSHTDDTHRDKHTKGIISSVDPAVGREEVGREDSPRESDNDKTEGLRRR